MIARQPHFFGMTILHIVKRGFKTVLNQIDDWNDIFSQAGHDDIGFWMCIYIIDTVVTFAFLDTGEGYGCQCFYREIGAM